MNTIRILFALCKLASIRHLLSFHWGTCSGLAFSFAFAQIQLNLLPLAAHPEISLELTFPSFALHLPSSPFSFSLICLSIKQPLKNIFIAVNYFAFSFLFIVLPPSCKDSPISISVFSESVPLICLKLSFIEIARLIPDTSFALNFALLYLSNIWKKICDNLEFSLRNPI